MLPFFALHVVSLVWLTRVCIEQKIFRPGRNAIVGKKTRKRLQRCAPGQWQRMELYQLCFSRVLSYVCAGFQSICSIAVLYHAMNCTVHSLTSAWCTIRFGQCCVIFAAWYCQRCNIHCGNLPVCQVLSSVCYLFACWQSPHLYALAVTLGFVFPIFPPAVQMHMLQVPQVDIPQPFRALNGKSCSSHTTYGDGACSIHSIFGSPTAS